MAYAPYRPGQHGGGFDPNSGPFVQAQPNRLTANVHLGGGNFDPITPFSNPSVTAQPVQTQRPNFAEQLALSSQETTTYYPHPQQYHQQQQQSQYNNTQPGIIAKLCACFR